MGKKRISVELKQVVNDIGRLRNEALGIAQKEHDINDAEKFYDVLMKYVYYNNEFNSRIGLFPNILSLLEERLSNNILNFNGVSFPYNYTFWFNYNPRYFSNEQLGRIINKQEVAYQVCRQSRDDKFWDICDILDSNNKTDYNVYYFNRVIGQGSKSKEYSDSVISVQEILSKHNEIELIKIYKDDSDHIVWDVKNYGDDKDYNENNDGSTDVENRIFDNVEQLQNYTYFLKKTFGILVEKSEIPPYLDEQDDDFKMISAKYIPKALYICNLSAPFSSKDNYSGSIMFASNADFDTVLIAREINNIKSIVGLITDVEAKYLTTLNKRFVIRQSIKSAKAAIMSRNMSHNIGSHVMSYLKQHLGSVKDIVADGILSDLINGENELAKKLENTTETTTLPFLMGLGHFISYLQERQDFIATIATDYIPYYGNVNFKDSIYDELNPDKRAERHSDRKNGATNNILLGNIARSEGLGRQTCPTQKKDDAKESLNDIVLKFREHFDGSPVVKLDAQGNIEYEINPEGKEELDDMRKYDFSLPGGIVGRQAFFSIMENIIRNAAKHGSWRNKKKLEFTFDIFSSKQEDLKRLEKKFSNDNINENCLTLKEVLEKYYLRATDSKDLYFITITDNCKAVEKINGEYSLETLGKLRASMVSRYITDSGEMDGANKGLKEMRISAAWMRAISDETDCFEPYKREYSANPKVLEEDKYAERTPNAIWESENTTKRAPLLYARISAKKNNNGRPTATNLQYIICVQIPKKVAVILGDNEDLTANQEQLDSINWRLFNKESFINEKNKSYEFILIDDECKNSNDIYCEIRSCATSRTFLFSQVKGLERTSFINELKNDNHFDGKDTMLLLYENLSGYKDKERIVVDDKIVNKKWIDGKLEKGDGVFVCDGYTNGGDKYIYRRHHEADIEFTGFMKSNLTTLFVEGITGNNSTDRLVRNETLDDYWFYRHLHAMKQRIAVFDERLFHKITGLEERNLNSEEVPHCKDNCALAMLQKNIYPFTIIEDKNNKHHFLVKGILFNDDKPFIQEEVVKADPQSPINSYKCKCGTLASITFNEGILNITPTTQGGYMKKHFNYITIHQGLLDKLYEAYNIKGEKDKIIAVTNRLFKEYSCQTILVNNFLPGMIIHSGRSKPNRQEMPQKLPFVQYAALDHAVMDCKYSLVELLDYARYEE